VEEAVLFEECVGGRVGGGVGEEQAGGGEAARRKGVTG
jgi:hypothetical protein